MGNRDDRFRSSYDPMFSGRGKMEPPKEPPQNDQAQLRGCGDPNCTRCNPHTVLAGSSSFARPNLGDALMAAFVEMTAHRSFGSANNLAFTIDLAASAAQSDPKREPPPSYIEARKAVQAYLKPVPEQTFADIVGNDDALSTLRDAIQAPVKHKALYEAYGMKMPKGALLSGPPGCGKTMFARAAASEIKALYGGGVEFLACAGSDLQTMYVGQTEKIIREIFAFAREYRAFHGHPLLVFLDEAEVILPDRTGRIRRVAPWEESQVATFLSEMDGVQESGAFVLLATNRPEVIDQAVLRDGRCDFKITVKRPTQAAVEVILTNNFAGTLIGDDPREVLVTAALEALYDPHKVIMEARAIGIDVEHLKIKNLLNRHFLLDHIVSGAMAASIPARATRYAFARDKAAGVAKGVTVADVCRAVNDLFEENKSLEHAFALDEFKRDFMRDLAARETSGAAHG